MINLEEAYSRLQKELENLGVARKQVLEELERYKLEQEAVDEIIGEE